LVPPTLGKIGQSIGKHDFNQFPPDAQCPAKHQIAEGRRKKKQKNKFNKLQNTHVIFRRRKVSNRIMTALHTQPKKWERKKMSNSAGLTLSHVNSHWAA
jgi:hypothetical protein